MIRNERAREGILIQDGRKAGQADVAVPGEGLMMGRGRCPQHYGNVSRRLDIAGSIRPLLHILPLPHLVQSIETEFKCTVWNLPAPPVQVRRRLSPQAFTREAADPTIDARPQRSLIAIISNTKKPQPTRLRRSMTERLKGTGTDRV